MFPITNTCKLTVVYTNYGTVNIRYINCSFTCIEHSITVTATTASCNVTTGRNINLACAGSGSLKKTQTTLKIAYTTNPVTI